MRYVIFTLVLLLSSSPAKSEFAWGAGIGVQYGGFLGAQASYRIYKTKLRASLGVVGVSAGVEQLLAKNVSIGYQTFAVGFSSGWGFFGNYYFPEKNDKRIVLGVDYIRRSNYVFITVQEENNNKVLFSLGYLF